jgi:hypothetical protein
LSSDGKVRERLADARRALDLVEELLGDERGEEGGL